MIDDGVALLAYTWTVHYKNIKIVTEKVRLCMPEDLPYLSQYNYPLEVHSTKAQSSKSPLNVKCCKHTFQEVDSVLIF